ncbi:MAG: hypothetical protein ACK553_15515 [Planctomycetota bacterium]|jgi:hypothetical protein
MDARDEEAITELEFMPDGRIFIFGASGEILDILHRIQQARDPVVAERSGSNSALPTATIRSDLPEHE